MEQSNNMDNEIIDLREILAILRKRYLVIVVITLVTLMTSGILSFFVLAPVYETEAVLLVTQAAPDDRSYSYYREEGMQGLMNTISKMPEMTINTYVGQLKSEAVMEKVVKQLKLDQAGYTARGLAGMISVQAVKNTNLIELRVAHTDPILATKIANTLTQEFLVFMSENNEQQMGKSVEFLTKQAVTAGEELKKAMTSLNNLDAQSRGVPMLEQQIKSKTDDLSKYQSLLLEATIAYQQLQAGKKQAEIQLKNTPPTLKTLKDVDGSGKITEVNEINPAYNQLRTMVNEKAVAVAETAVEVKSTQAAINQLTEGLKGMQTELAQKKNSLQLAKNEVVRLEETNSMIRTKIDETRIGKSLNFGDTNLNVISPATIPDGPIKPNKTLNMAVALVLGLMVSTGLAFLLNYLDNTVKSPKELEELGLPVLGQIPYYRLDKPETVGR